MNKIKAVIVDDEPLAAEYLEMLCQDMQELDLAGVFYNSTELFAYLETSLVQLVFMDIEMPGINGLEAVRELRKRCPEVCVIFVTGYEKYAFEAFGVDAVSYLLKPCSGEELARAVERAMKLLPSWKKRVRFETLGQFNMILDGEPYRFANRKAKELLALLVDRRGEIVHMEEAVSLLWEGRPYDDMVKQLYRKAVIALNQLMKINQLDFFVSNRGSCHIIPSKVDCDYYELMDGNEQVQRAYDGYYMTQYSWAEDTIGKINHFLSKKYEEI